MSATWLQLASGWSSTCVLAGSQLVLCCGHVLWLLQEKHVEEVVRANENLLKSKYSEEKVLEKLQKALKNRENFLEEQKNKLRAHVRPFSMVNSCIDDSIPVVV